MDKFEFVTERFDQDMTVKSTCTCGFRIILSDQSLEDMTMTQLAEARRQHEQMIQDHLEWHYGPARGLKEIANADIQ